MRRCYERANSTRDFTSFFICVEGAECDEIPSARIAFGDQVFSSSPSKFRQAELDGDHVGDQAGMAPVSVGKRMDFRNKLMMKANQTFVDRKCLVVQPIPDVANELWNTLRNFARITAYV